MRGEAWEAGNSGFREAFGTLARGTRTNRRDVVSLQVIDDVGDRIDPFLDGEGEAVVLGANEICDELRVLQVRAAIQSDRERLQRVEVVSDPIDEEPLSSEPRDHRSD